MLCHTKRKLTKHKVDGEIKTQTLSLFLTDLVVDIQYETLTNTETNTV